MRRRFIEQIIGAQEDERRRIARELHDTMAQSLTSLLVGLRALEDQVVEQEARNQLQSLRQLTASTIQEAQRLARGLRPSVLDDLGFAPAMERLVADAESAHGFCVDLHISGFEGQVRLPPTMETALYRILQEGLTNVGRHAEATNVDLLIERSATCIRAVVEDNGKGFAQGDARRAREGLGIVGIHERAALLHGQAMVDSSPDSGTTLTVTLPLK
jgi:signal transduction histidine kinase